jgi:hypothetical protein
MIQSTKQPPALLFMLYLVQRVSTIVARLEAKILIYTRLVIFLRYLWTRLNCVTSLRNHVT